LRQERTVKRHRLFIAVVGLSMLSSANVQAAKPPANWDGLVQVKSKRLELVYLYPGADFRGYTKILLEPTEVAFRKNWQRDYNSASGSLSSRVSDREVEEAISAGVRAAHDIFAEAWTKGGYAIVTEPGPDVLRVKTGVMNVSVSAPDRPSAGRSYTFASEAGYATLFVEARDSLSGALLGRAVDNSIAGDSSTAWRTRVSNRADFRDLAQRWAEISVRGMAELKSLSPIAR
jgi:Protein of unknown function (DUF3313)